MLLSQPLLTPSTALGPTWPALIAPARTRFIVRHCHVRLCDDEDAALELFLSEPHPRVSAEEVSIAVSEGERVDGSLSETTLLAAKQTLDEYGVVCLRGVWDAKPPLVNSLVGALEANYDACIGLVGERSGLSADDSFGYRQIVHRSQGRYDMLLEDGVAAAPLPSALRDSVLGGAWRRELLARLLGQDFKVEFTAALLAKSGCAPQDPHADGAHPHQAEHDDDASSPLPPHALQLFLPLCEMSVAAGPTEFWPTSHLAENAPFASLLPSLPLEAAPGDAIVFDFRVIHRGMANTAGYARPILYQTCTCAWFVDDFNFPVQSLLDETEMGDVEWEQQIGVQGARSRSGFVK